MKQAAELYETSGRAQVAEPYETSGRAHRGDHSPAVDARPGVGDEVFVRLSVHALARSFGGKPLDAIGPTYVSDMKAVPR